MGRIGQIIVPINKKRIRKGEIGRDLVDQGNNVMLLTESNMGDEVATVGMAAAILSLSTVGARNCRIAT